MHPKLDINQSSNKFVAIFYPWANMGAFTSLRDALVILIEHGYRVDFYNVYDGSYPSPDLDEPGLSIINRPEVFINFPEIYPKLIHRINKGGKPYRWWMMNVFHPLRRMILRNKFLLQQHASHPYCCIIGIDPNGIISALPIAKMFHLPLVYWSLELLFTSEITRSEDKNLKYLEVEGSRQASITIVQDRWRGKALIDENGLDPAKIIYVPNAPRGIARRKKSNYLHKRLNISPEKKIILCTGSIAHWSMIAEIVAASSEWPNNYLLVIQSRRNNNSHLSKYIKDLMKLVDPKKVIISFDPVPQSDFRTLVDSADVGLAFYAPDQTKSSTLYGKNISLIGFSSGKISGYLFSGVPIIVNEAAAGGLREMVSEFGCGICVSDPSKISIALKDIFEDYEKYSSSACTCFQQLWELEKNFLPVIEKFRSYSNG